MSSEHWDLDQDNTLGGNNPSPNKVSSQKALKEFATEQLNKKLENKATSSHSLVILGNDDTSATESVVIGEYANSYGQRNVSIKGTSSAIYSVSIGEQARIGVKGNYSIQLGFGEINEPGVFYVGFFLGSAANSKNYKLLDGTTGKIPDDRLNDTIAKKTDIPSFLSEFTDDLGTSPTHSHSQYLTSHQDISGKQDTITGGASTITSSNLTTGRVLISNASGKVAVSSITSTQLSYLSGITGNIQTQLNAKQNKITITYGV